LFLTPGKGVKKEGSLVKGGNENGTNTRTLWVSFKKSQETDGEGGAGGKGWEGRKKGQQEKRRFATYFDLLWHG